MYRFDKTENPPFLPFSLFLYLQRIAQGRGGQALLQSLRLPAVLVDRRDEEQEQRGGQGQQKPWFLMRGEG